MEGDLKEAKTSMTEDENLIQDAIEHIRSERMASVSFLQRRMRLGYVQASRIIQEIEFRKLIGPHNGSEPREISI